MLFPRFSSVIAVYIVGGFLYQRLVVGAKGMEQFPHFAFWQDLGNLVAVSESHHRCSVQPDCKLERRGSPWGLETYIRPRKFEAQDDSCGIRFLPRRTLVQLGEW